MQDSSLRQETERVSFGTPSEVREFPRGRVELVSIGGAEVGRLVLAPGWRQLRQWRLS